MDFLIRTCCFVLSSVYGELMLVPPWELGVVLDRGYNEMLACGGAVVFCKLEDGRTVINLGFINNYTPSRHRRHNVSQGNK